MTLRPEQPLRLPFVPRDLFPLDAQGDPLGARGNVEVAQRGVNVGLVYFRLDEPRFGSVLYVQDLTALNRYFRATGTKPVGAGARVVTFGRDGDALDQARADAPEGSGSVAGLTADIATREGVDRVFAAVARMRGGGGQLLFVSSISATIKARGESVYAATKAGVNAFAETLRKEVAERGIRVSIIEPGSVATDMQACSTDEQRAAVARGEMLHANAIADAILFALTRDPGCDVVSLRIEPRIQNTA